MHVCVYIYRIYIYTSHVHVLHCEIYIYHMFTCCIFVTYAQIRSVYLSLSARFMKYRAVYGKLPLPKPVLIAPAGRRGTSACCAHTHTHTHTHRFCRQAGSVGILCVVCVSWWFFIVCVYACACVCVSRVCLQASGR